jgi:hypothetical protein
MSDDHPTMQVRHFWGRGAIFAMLLVVGFGLSGCGKKPNHVDPPLSVEDDTFPRIYPDLDTDPKPDLDARPDLAPPAPPKPTQPKHQPF